jgi:CheY-like chemotaxis protein
MNKKILIADDSKETRTLLHMFLEKEGYTIIESTNGSDALAKIHSEQPDLVILDLIMPVIDGVTVAIELDKNQKTENIPVIISTSRGQLKDLLDLKDIKNIKGFIEKPFKPEAILEKVRSILK